MSDMGTAFASIREHIGPETCGLATSLHELKAPALISQHVEQVATVNHHLRQTLAALVVAHSRDVDRCPSCQAVEHHPKCMLGRLLKDMDTASPHGPKDLG